MVRSARFVRHATLPFALLVLAGCGRDSTQKAAENGVVLARVNGTEITRSEVEASIARSFGSEQKLDEKRAHTVLESLVVSRAIALARVKELDDAERAALELKVTAYREEVLVRDYLAKHAPPERVTNEQAEQYYRAHSERFGGGQVKRYELIASDRELAATERDSVLRAVSHGAEQKDWSAWSTQLRANRLPLVFSAGRGNEQALHDQLRQLIGGLSLGQSSAVTFIEGRVYLARVVGSEPIEPVPFDQVSAQIKEYLAPTQVKKSLEQAKAAVLPKAKIEYLH